MAITVQPPIVDTAKLDHNPYAVSIPEQTVHKTNACSTQLIKGILSENIPTYMGGAVVASTLGGIALTIGLKAFILGSLAIAFGISPIGWIAAGGALLLLGLALIGRLISASSASPSLPNVSPSLAKTGFIEHGKMKDLGKTPEEVEALWNVDKKRGLLTYLDENLVPSYGAFERLPQLSPEDVVSIRKLTMQTTSAPILEAQAREISPGMNAPRFEQGLSKPFEVYTSNQTVTMTTESRLAKPEVDSEGDFTGESVYAEDIAYSDQIIINYRTNEYTITRTPIAVDKKIWGDTLSDLRQNRVEWGRQVAANNAASEPRSGPSKSA